MSRDWETCVECEGVRILGRDRCFAHTLNLDAVPSSLRSDLRGVRIDALLVTSILNRAGRDDADYPILAGARFDHAVFTDVADFQDVRFEHGVSFVRATFEGPAIFRGARSARVDFDVAVFEEEADFASAVFGDATFRRTSFGRAVSFANATFDGPARFGGADFRGTTDLTFSHAESADFARARFDDTTQIATKLEGALTLNDALFGGLTTIDVDAPTIEMQDVLWAGQLEATLDSDEVSIRRSRLERGGRITLARGSLSLEDARLARPTLIAAARGGDAPRLGDLSGADLSGTTLSGLDLTHTRFVGCHGLDGLRIDGRLKLARVGGGLSTRTRRLVIADETHVRAQPSSSGADIEDVAGVYRDLPASQEGRKDEPGSADFYYGEMEMRRLAAAALSGERVILGTYRAVSGYGLRPSRSLLTLAGLILGATVAFHAGLIEDAPGWTATLLVALRSTVSFVREPTLAGMGLEAEYLQLLLRFAGPVLLALAAIAIRARVRR